ncbi:MAG: hypothetical protein ACTSU5_20065 [Promethearchaeota archaeon]
MTGKKKRTTIKVGSRRSRVTVGRAKSVAVTRPKKANIRASRVVVRGGATPRRRYLDFTLAGFIVLLVLPLLSTEMSSELFHLVQAFFLVGSIIFVTICYLTITTKEHVLGNLRLNAFLMMFAFFLLMFNFLAHGGAS